MLDVSSKSTLNWTLSRADFSLMPSKVDHSMLCSTYLYHYLCSVSALYPQKKKHLYGGFFFFLTSIYFLSVKIWAKLGLLNLPINGHNAISSLAPFNGIYYITNSGFQKERIKRLICVTNAKNEGESLHLHRSHAL